MQHRTKQILLIVCLFLFLFAVMEGGLHLSPFGAFLAALTGTPLIAHAFNVWNRKSREASTSSNRIVTLRARDASAADSANLVRH
jgi:hypothetical protein